MDPASVASGEVLVHVPLVEGELDDAGKGILAEAGKLARTLGAAWRASRLSGAQEAAEAAFGAYGVPAILEITGDPALGDCPEALADAVAGAARQVGARVVLLAHNDVGSQLAPGLARRLGAALFTEAIAFAADERGLRLTRPLLGRQVAEHRIWDGSQPLVLTANPRVLSTVVLPSMASSDPAVTRWAFPGDTSRQRVRVVERIPPDPQTVDVTEAEVIFCGGKGLDAERFEQFCEVARLLHASLGVTRPVYDMGWTGFERMIGQTGKTVAPRFYLGMGISGSMHHVGGIKDSKALYSLNVDPKAPMFPNSDEGFVGDAREVLPRLLAKVRAAVGGAT